MLFTITIALLSIFSSVWAAPVCSKRAPSTTAQGDITEAQLITIAPSSVSCTGATSECRTAAQAASLLNAAHQQFNITTRGEKAALVSLQAFESGDFKFDRNQAGNPGQGTRNEMNIPFIYQYALDTPSTAAAALTLVPKGTDVSTVSPDTKNAVLALMLADDLSFASAAWFLKRSAATSGTGCSQSIIEGLQAATEPGWEAYITQCVGTTVTPERKQVYDAALAAFN